MLLCYHSLYMKTGTKSDVPIILKLKKVKVEATVLFKEYFFKPCCRFLQLRVHGFRTDT